MSQKILVTRDAVLIQSRLHPGSSGLLLPWLHDTYCICQSFQSAKSFIVVGVPERDAYCICTHTCFCTCASRSKAARIAFVSQLAAACQECADVHVNTYRLAKASASALQQLFDTLENVFEGTRLCTLSRSGALCSPPGPLSPAVMYTF